MYFVVCVGLCWARVGTRLGLSWAILGYVGTFWATLAPYWVMLSHFNCILWFLLAFVGQELGPYWAMLGHFGQRWHHIGLMLGHFALFSDLCRPLPWTWAFQCR